MGADGCDWDPEGGAAFDLDQHPQFHLMITRARLPVAALLTTLIEKARPPPRPSVSADSALPAINFRPGFRRWSFNQHWQCGVGEGMVA